MIFGYDKIKVEPVWGKVPPLQGKYRLCEDFHIWYFYDDQLKKVKINKGFEFDGASVPRVLWSLVGSPYLPSFLIASLVHDYQCDHYDNSGRCEDYLHEMSELFYHLLVREGVSVRRAKMMYLSVLLYKKWF